jgi:hypothetical protein
MYIDHGQYHSLYFNDPNSLNLEITFKAPGTIEFETLSRKTAHSILSDWGAKRDQLVASRKQPAAAETK